MRSKNTQSGVALITVMFATTLIAALAVAMMSRLAIDVRRNEYQRNAGQMLHVIYGAEAWAIGRLQRDQDNDARDGIIDHGKETWNDKIKLEIIKNAANVSASILDQQARFNLNNLATDQKAMLKQHYAIFKRLLNTLEIDARLADAVVDWVDKDIEARFPAGAEDNSYTATAPHYRAANRPMANLSELYMIKGMTAEIIKKLQPFVTALPGTTAINVNTASAEVLTSLSPVFDKQIVERIIEEREQKPFKTTKVFADFIRRLTGKPKLNPPDLEKMISVSSSYFLLESSIVMRRSRLAYRSLLSRINKKISVYHRSRRTH